MNYKTAKNIDILSYLKKVGKEPERIRGNNAWFISILRNESTASLKIDIEKNLWYDFGAGVGGSIIDLLMYLNNYSATEAIQTLSNNSFSFHHQEKQIRPDTKYSIKKVIDLVNPNLLIYLSERKINLDFARQFCSQVHYTFDDKKEYYAVGFKNDKGAYELRNKFFKGCLGSKSITTIYNDSDVLSLFESWSDFLSYLTLKKEIPNEDFIILNSTSMVKKVFELVLNYSEIKVFFDNDEAGDRATNLVLESTKSRIADQRVHYKNYNDLNDFLINRFK